MDGLATQNDIIAYMFRRSGSGDLDALACLKLWFGKDAETDATIAARFGSLVQTALAGGLDGWMETPRGSLALMILLDQFPRNIYRHTKDMFAGDGRARGVVDAGHAWLDVLRPEECLFVPCLILTHQENLDDQRQCLEFYDRLEARLPKDFRVFRTIFDEHLRIIDLVGHFPHRDHYYGRETSEIGRRLLDNPQMRFDLPLIVDGGAPHFGYDALKLWRATEHALEVIERLDALTDEHRADGFGSLAPTWLTPKQVVRVKETFREFDLDGDNVLGRDELIHVLDRLGHHYSPERAQEAIDRITHESNAPGIHFDQFAALLRTDLTSDSEKRLRNRFKMFDREGHGYIDEEELKLAIHGIDELVTSEEIHDMLRFAARDGDGLIHFEDFLRLMRELAELDHKEDEEEGETSY